MSVSTRIPPHAAIPTLVGVERLARQSVKFTDPDQAVRWAHEARVRAESASAFDPVAMKGHSYKQTCQGCGKKPYVVRIRRRTGELYAVCRRCDRERPSDTIYILREPGKGSGVDPSEHLVALADVEVALEAAAKRDERAALAHRALIVAGVSMGEFLIALENLGGIRLTIWTLKRTVRVARAYLATELARRNLLDADPRRWTDAPRHGPAKGRREGS